MDWKQVTTLALAGVAVSATTLPGATPALAGGTRCAMAGDYRVYDEVTVNLKVNRTRQYFTTREGWVLMLDNEIQKDNGQTKYVVNCGKVVINHHGTITEVKDVTVTIDTGKHLVVIHDGRRVADAHLR
jgi:hypothetical protein